MASFAQYRQYMDECLRAAAEAKSAEERTSLLQLAQTWHRAATSPQAIDKVAEETLQALERVSNPEEQVP
jgi:hypothetical protein